MEYALIALTAINSLLLIGIAGSLAKLIRYNQVEQDSKEEWEEILKSRRNLDKQKRSPNYSETSMVAPSIKSCFRTDISFVVNNLIFWES